MVCLTLLFIVILTTVSKVTSLHCSDQQLSASGDDDLQQVTTLQYCLLDNCTIMMIDTGEELDIVYTTDSLIVTTSTDGRTSEVIARQEREPLCLESTSTHQITIAGELVATVLIHIMSWYIITVHVMFKDLRNAFGKLLMLYNIAVICCAIGFTSRFLSLFQLAPNSLVICYPSTLSFLFSTVSVEALGTCILHHIAATVRRSYKLKSQMSQETSQRYFRHYMIYTLGTMFLVLFLVICFDTGTGNYRKTLLPNGQCVSIQIHIYGTLIIPGIVNAINKIAQMMQFIIYLNYTYKLNKYVTDAGVSSESLSILHKTAIALGAMIGLSQIAFAIQTSLNYDTGEVIIPTSIGLFLVQQCTFVAILMFTKKVCGLCRERFLKD